MVRGTLSCVQRPMTHGAERFAFREFGFAADFAPRPHTMGDFGTLVAMVRLKVVSGATCDTGLAGKPLRADTVIAL